MFSVDEGQKERTVTLGSSAPIGFPGTSGTFVNGSRAKSSALTAEFFQTQTAFYHVSF